MLRRKFFGNVKNGAQRNVSANALYVCTTVMQEKPSGVYKMQETAPDHAGRAYSAHPDPIADG